MGTDEQRQEDRPRVLVAGATGFVGRHLRPALEAAGYELRLTSRNPHGARHDDPGGHWMRLDMEDPDSLPPALEGCDAAVYLIHQMVGRADYSQREPRAADLFARRAEQAGVRRIVYLGGVVPAGATSRHLQSRARTGEVLRAAPVPVVELRAAMIIGAGSASWTLVHDLSRRLPAMVLPRWLRNHSWPVAIDDVVAGILAGLQLPAERVGCYDVPGPERVSHRDILRRTAAHLRRRPLMINVPVVTPRLSSYWLGLVTNVDLGLARELLDGLLCDLDPTGPTIWQAVGDGPHTSLDDAIRHALADQEAHQLPTHRARERLTRLGRQHPARSVP
jgi:uncharacterized protein YbjT (DUF2867 family)